MVENEPATEPSLAPELQPLLRAWRECSALVGRPLSPDEFVPSFSPRWLGSIALIAPGVRSGFVITTCGYDLIRRFGRFAGGHRVATLAPGIAWPLSAKLHLAARSRAPAVWRPVVQLGREPIHFSELILPLSQDGVSVCLLLLAALEARRRKPNPPPVPEFCLPD